jgi:hypothetical protein
MPRLPWTKFQDFYLRIGFLKALVGILDPHRRSVPNEALIRRLERALFSPARARAELWNELVDRFPWAPDVFENLERKSAKRFQATRPTMSEALLLLGGCPSPLDAITPKTAYKILDWGRNLQFIGAGNQITEKGLILRSMLPTEHEAFLRGDPSSWNPFLLTPRERLFLLFHVAEVDHLTLEIIDELSRSEHARTIEAMAAKEITCRAFFRVLDRGAKQVSSADLPALRRARELASVMAREIQMENVGSTVLEVRQRMPRPKKIPRTAAGLEKKATRRTTKNADHQTIPRFELLVDLGFLTKPCPNTGDTKATWECRRHWRYQRLPNCATWQLERQRTLDGIGPWEWRGFARAAVSSEIAMVQRRSDQASMYEIGQFLWSGYRSVRRRVGHTPFHSIAMAAMIEAAASGFAIEMRTFHELFMTLKRRALLQECVFFASGNEIDRMFVVICDDFVDRLKALPPEDLELSRWLMPQTT